MIGSGHQSNASIGSFVELNLGTGKSFLERFASANSMTLGFSEDELKSMSGLELVHPDDNASMHQKMDALKEGATVYFEGRYRCKNGGFRWLGWTAAPFRRVSPCRRA